MYLPCTVSTAESDKIGRLPVGPARQDALIPLCSSRDTLSTVVAGNPGLLG